MSTFKLLIVEDDIKQIGIYKSCVERYKVEHGTKIETVESQTFDDAISKLDNTFDAAIIDLKLNTDIHAGNKIIKQINDRFRIPVIVITARPADIDTEESTVYKVYVRGHDFQSILADIFALYNTGITKIMGGRGEIEDAMNNIFWTNIFPQINHWVGKNVNTEKALLRFVINHLQESLVTDDEKCYVEEMYIAPPICKETKNGSIIKHTSTSKYFIVLSPACDLVVRSDGEIKTDKILICEIDEFDAVKNNVLNGITARDKKTNKLKELLKNNHTGYYHWLPKHPNFNGGVINFRWVKACSKDMIKNDFEKPEIQISSAFIKDIQSRFSIYYARQGQPDFDFDNITNMMLDNP